jgi:hypothetical protein
MAGLMIADEVNDLKVRLDRAEAELARNRDARAAAPDGDGSDTRRAAAAALSGAADRIEALAAKLLND